VWAEVAIRSSGAISDDIFTYQVPEALQEQIALGLRVEVDFGGRRREAYVLALSLTAPAEANPPAAKEIVTALEEYTLLTPEMVTLGVWMADYYACPASLCLDIMIPGRFSRARGRKVFWAADAPEPEHPFLQYLAQNGPLPWEEALQQVYLKELDAWRREGIIGYTFRYRHEALPPELKAQVYVAQAAAESISPRARKQRELMAYLQLRGAVGREELRRHFSAAVLRAALEKGWIAPQSPKVRAIEDPDYALSAGQQAALDYLTGALDRKKFAAAILFGVTGSGKTEVYIRAVTHCLRQGRSALILVPEITLAQQMLQMLSARFPALAVLHSGLAEGERSREWERIRRGEATVVMGARSAVFAPLRAIGLVILDEEQEESYKNEERPRYHAREVARRRAYAMEAVFLRGSATPTVEALAEVERGETALLTLQNRVATASQLHISLEDRRQFQRQNLGPGLIQAISASLQQREQVLLFVNRRGYAPRTICRSCGSPQLCPHCAVALVYHVDLGRHVCHYCNYSPPHLDSCGNCGSEKLTLTGLGTQKLEEEVRRLFPEARIARLDLDTRRRKNRAEEILQQMQRKEIDILIGTQMIAKGLHFPAVALVGVVDADALLALPDFRSDERAFQLILQVAGRSGRGDMEGRAIIQTYQPDNPLMRLLVRQDYLPFASREMEKRRSLDYPPFTHFCRLVVYGKNEALVQARIAEITGLVTDLLDAQEAPFSLYGPAPCPIRKVRDRYRYQLMLKSPHRPFLTSMVKRLKLRASPETRLEIDFDPVSTM
jgi:primosomal protein N' (replication factor Y)